MLLHIQALRANSKQIPPSLWQQLTPQTRVICMLISIFASVFTPNGQWSAWLIYSSVVLTIIYCSRLSWSVLASRILIEFAFFGMILLGTLFRSGGDTLWSWGWLRITTEGVVVLGSVTFKVLISLLWANLLILTTEIPQLLQALLLLRCPAILVAIMASMSRNLNLLIGEFTTMRRAALSRNLLLTPKSARRVIGNMIGSLFIRTLDRGDRIYQAMLARGYCETEVLVFAQLPPYRRIDAIALVSLGLITLLGKIMGYRS